MPDEGFRVLRIQWGRPHKPDIIRTVAKRLPLPVLNDQRCLSLPLQGDGFQCLHSGGRFLFHQLQQGIAEGRQDVIGGNIHLSVTCGKVTSSVHGRVASDPQLHAAGLHPAQRGGQAIALC